jgi:hypothetical protein
MIVFIGFIYNFIWSRPPVSLSTSLLHITPYHESCHFQASVNAWAGVLFSLIINSLFACTMIHHLKDHSSNIPHTFLRWLVRTVLYEQFCTNRAVHAYALLCVRFIACNFVRTEPYVLISTNRDVRTHYRACVTYWTCVIILLNVACTVYYTVLFGRIESTAVFIKRALVMSFSRPEEQVL